MTKEWDASSFQAELDELDVVMTLQGRVMGKTSENEWEDILDEEGNPQTVTLSDFSAVNSSQTYTTSVSKYNADGEEMEYRFVETGISYKGQKVELTEKIDEDAG